MATTLFLLEDKIHDISGNNTISVSAIVVPLDSSYGSLHHFGSYWGRVIPKMVLEERKATLSELEKTNYDNNAN